VRHFAVALLLPSLNIVLEPKSIKWKVPHGSRAAVATPGRSLFSFHQEGDIGIFGNSHMMMLDKDNDEIVDLIVRWVETNVWIKGK
jgi:hypothetical protein